MDPREQKSLDELNAQLGFREVWAQGYYGQGITIALIDTAIALDDTSVGDYVIARHDYSSEKHPHPIQMMSHAAKMAQSIHYVAPQATIINYNVFPSTQPSFWLQNLQQCKNVRRSAAKAIDDAASSPTTHIINLSLAVSRGIIRRCSQKVPCELCRAVNSANAAGTVVIAAAGNAGPAVDTIECPGQAVGAITVGAHISPETAERFKNQNLLPGEEVGTSYSCAYISAGTALLLSADPTATPEQIRSAFTSSARALANVPTNEQGAGRASLPLALNALIGPQ
jgi:subtilisin family serine protease